MMPIKGISTIYRPQRQGKIHLGVKVTKKKDGTDCSPYPSEVDFFVLNDAPELIPFYGERPMSLNVTLPSARFERENLEAYMEKVFPQYLKRYKASGLMCKGDGETANAVTEKGIEEIACPCDFLDKGECKRIGILRVRVQEIPSFNVYQITTSSFNSIVNINSFVRDLAEHCIVSGIDLSSVKLTLRRQETVTQRLEKGESKKSTHHVMVLDLDPRFYRNLDDVRLRALPQSQAKPLALPPPDESPDPLFLKSEAEVSDANEDAPAETKPPIEAPVEAAAKTEAPVGQPSPLPEYEAQLAEVLARLKEAKGVVSLAEQKRLAEIKTEVDFKKAIAYYGNRIKMIGQLKGMGR
jgi:hypothetical protein